MRHAHFALLCVASLAGPAACGEGDERPPASLDGTSGSSSAGGKSSRAGSGSQSDAGAEPTGESGAGGGAAGQGGASGEGIVYETAGAPTFVPGLCEPGLMLGAEAPQALAPALPGATLLSLTPDERSAVFVTGEEAELRLYVADRASLEDAFDAQEVALPQGYDAASGATLSSDALTLVVVLADHSGFGALSRTGRGEPFDEEADTSAFSRINAQKAMSGRELGWPVLSNDGGTLYFLSYFGQGLVVQSTRGADGRFDLGQEIDPFTLGGGDGAYKLIHAVSADQRAIFFFDEATEHSMALFRSQPNAPFYEPLDLGEWRGVSPNADCSRLYSSLDGSLVAHTVK